MRQLTISPGAVFASAAVVVLAAISLVAQSDPSIARVGSLSQLRARTPDERARAEYFRHQTEKFDTNVFTLKVLLDGSGFKDMGPGGTPVVPPPDPPPEAIGITPEEFPAWKEAMRKQQLAASLHSWVCLADGVVIGRATSGHTLMDSSESWLFTDYQIAVERWIYQRSTNTTTPRPAIDRLLMTQLGGQVEVSGRELETKAWDPIVLHERYVFFLENIRVSNTFGTKGAFSLRDSKVTTDRMWGITADRDEYLAGVDRAAASCSSSK